MRKAIACMAIAAATALTATPAHAQQGWTRAIASEPHALEINSFLFTRSNHGVVLWRGFDQARGPGFYPALSLATFGGVWRRGPDVAGFTPVPGEVFSYGRHHLLLFGLVPNGRSRGRDRQAPAIAYGEATDGSFGAPRLLASDAASVPAADVNISGDAVAAWSQGVVVRAAERSAGHRFRDPHTRTPRGASRAAVAINTRGDRVLAWYREGNIEARIRRRGHNWGRTVRIGRASPYPERIEATIGADGRILVAWGAASIREGHPTLAEARLAVRDRGRWRQFRLERFRTTGPFPPEPRALPVIDSRGLVWISWTGLAGNAPVVRLARVSGTTVGTPVTVSAPGGALDDAAAGLQGDLGLSWSVVGAGGASTPFVRLRSASGALGPAVQLTAASESALAGTQVAFVEINGFPSVAWLLRAEAQAALVVSTAVVPPA
jgi:hypothetical protein